jgi:predicted restriction endonuclease
MKKNKKIEYTCNMCGKKYFNKVDNNQGYKNKEDILPASWIHEIDLEKPSYPSKLDEQEIQNFHLCDDCLIELLKSFKIQPLIKNIYNDNVEL